MIQRLRWLLFFSFLTTSAFAQSYKYHNEWIDYNKTYYKFKVMGLGLDNVNVPIRKGMVRIPYSTLVTAGLSGTASENFQLWRDGEEVPLYISRSSGILTTGDYIEFFGEINNGKLDKELYLNPDYQLNDKWSLQTDTAAYFLTVNNAYLNKRLVTVDNNTSNTNIDAESYFMYTIGRYFRNGGISNGFSASLGENLYSSSYDKGEGWVSRSIKPNLGCGTATLPQGFDKLFPYLSANAPLATLRVNTVGDAQNSRTVRININNDSITTYQMDYVNYVKDEEQISVDKLSSGNITVYVVNQSPVECDEMRAPMIELSYPRLFNFGGASKFDFTLEPSPTGRYLKITNFNHGGISPVLYDVANGKRYVGDISNPDTVKVLLQPSDIAYNLILTTQSGTYYKDIKTIETRNFINYASQDNQGNYLIISNPLIYGSGSTNYVEQYRQYRLSIEGGSFNAKIVDINQLVDQFAWGVKKHPLSIKNFLRYARNNFVDSPKYVFLIGKGVVYIDYRNNEGNALAERLNLVPTWGSPASDNLLASDDLNAIPAIPIGRLSAVTPQEVGDYLLKVKQHDSVQRSPVYTLEAKSWMKNVLHVAGANDLGLGNQFDQYLDNYKGIIQGKPFGANVLTFSKAANPEGYTDAINSFKTDYEQGASLITYFGHSSNSSLDFNLDNPQNYNNLAKYPIFIANGCSAGNHFIFEADRLNTKSTISEKFVLTPQRGAIGYLASSSYGIINYLNIYTHGFYRALADTRYNQTVGTVVKEAIQATLDSTGTRDFYSRVHAEQYSYHGDPAIKINSSALPDYVMEASQITVSPSAVSIADTAFNVTVRVNNIGRATNNLVTLKVTRQNPAGQVSTIIIKKFAPINLSDSITIAVPIIGNQDKGRNVITATVDYDNKVAETSESNNTASTDLFITEDEIKLTYPYKYAVVTQTNFLLSASTVNPFSKPKTYMMQLDSTALFNSPLRIDKTGTFAGGVIQFDPGITYEAGVTYYWRIAAYDSVHPNWSVSSFVYKTKAISGFQQGHLYQNLESQLTRLAIDSISGSYSFGKKPHNLFITNSIYPTSGTEDEHFSVSVDGSVMMASACVGSSIVFQVLDPITFQPQQNLTQPFNAAPVCSAGREYNFEYQYNTAATRKNAMDFIDAIPTGSYVVARLVLDAPYNSFAANWAADTALYGKGNSLYHRLKQNGFDAIDSFKYARTWAFVFKKGDPNFKPAYVFSRGLYDRITLSVDCYTSNQQGFINSPVFGPAKAWRNILWSGHSSEKGNDRIKINLLGIRPGDNDTLLYVLDSSKVNFNISSLNAKQYPYLRLQMDTKDSVTNTPYQLTSWGLGYVSPPEGAIAPNLYLNIPDSVGSPNNVITKLKLGVAFKNVSQSNFDSLTVKVLLYDAANNVITYPIQKLRPLLAGDTMHIDLNLRSDGLNGKYNLYFEVNPANAQLEQFSFNNFLYKYITIAGGRALSVNLIDFNAVLSDNNVNTTWSVATETNLNHYEVQHSTDASTFTTIGNVLPSQTVDKNYSFRHLNPSKGKNYYRLKIVDNDGSSTYSSVRLVTVETGTAVNIHPNPVNDNLIISINRRDGKASGVRIINAYGQQVWHQKVTGTVQVNMHQYAAGSYLVQVDDGSSITSYKIQKQ